MMLMSNTETLLALGETWKSVSPFFEYVLRKSSAADAQVLAML